MLGYHFVLKHGCLDMGIVNCDIIMLPPNNKKQPKLVSFSLGQKNARHQLIELYSPKSILFQHKDSIDQFKVFKCKGFTVVYIPIHSQANK